MSELSELSEGVLSCSIVGVVGKVGGVGVVLMPTIKKWDIEQWIKTIATGDGSSYPFATARKERYRKVLQRGLEGRDGIPLHCAQGKRAYAKVHRNSY